MFAKHLPPSAGRPRVLALDEAAGRALPVEAVVCGPAPAPGPFDAIVGWAGPEALARWHGLLRPGGRLILAAPPTASPEALLDALTSAGFVHCLVEASAEGVLFRGERPFLRAAQERLRALAAEDEAPPLPFVFVLVWQTPNKPAWQLAPDEPVEWRAATLVDPGSGQVLVPGFSSLVKAVAFMQPAILAGLLTGVNKVGKYPAAQIATWAWPVLLNPEFAAWRGAALGPPLAVDPRLAITGDE